MLGKMIWRPLVTTCILFLFLLDSALGQEGPFTGNLSWQGTVNHNSNPWVWTQSQPIELLSLTPPEAERADGQYIWKRLLGHTVLLTGKTVRLLPAGRAGIEPLVHYGAGGEHVKVEWRGDGVARVTLPVRGSDDESDKKGWLSFSIRVVQTMVATHEGQRQWFNLYAEISRNDAGNGLPPRGKTLSSVDVADLQQKLAGHVPNHLSTASRQSRVGGEMARSQMRNPNMLAVGGIYRAEILSGSGQLSFPENAVPRAWKAYLPIQITYM